MQRLLVKLSILLLPVFALIIYTNFYVDPGGNYYNKDFDSKLFDLLEKGKGVKLESTNPNLGDVTRVIKFIENKKTPPDMALIGSSRSMPITSSMVHEKDFLNLGVHNPRLGDLIAMYESLREHKILPRKLVIELNPVIFTHDFKPKRKRFEDFFFRFTARTQNIQDSEIYIYRNPFYSRILDSLQYYAELLSPRYFQQSLKYLFLKKEDPSKQENEKLKFNIAKRLEASPNILTKDNSHFKKALKIDKKKRLAQCKSTLKHKLLDPKLEIVPETVNLFSKFLADLNKVNIEVLFLVLPFDCYFYDQEMEAFGSNNVIEKHDQLMKEFKEKFGEDFHYIGTGNPHDWQISYDDSLSYFFDAGHMSSHGISQLFSKIDYFNSKKK